MKILKTKRLGNHYYALCESDRENEYTVNVRYSRNYRLVERKVADIDRKDDKKFNVKMIQLVGIDTPQPIIVISLEECFDVAIKEYQSLCIKQKICEHKILAEYIKDMKDNLKKIKTKCLHILEETDTRRIQEIIYILDEINYNTAEKYEY